RHQQLSNYIFPQPHEPKSLPNHAQPKPKPFPFVVQSPGPSPPPISIASISFVTAQIRHPSPTRSLRSRAVVTFGPTVRDVLAKDPSSSVGVEGRGVCACDCESEACTCER